MKLDLTKHEIEHDLLGIDLVGGWSRAGGSGGGVQELVGNYLNLDQSTPETITGGIPIFQEGMAIGNANIYFKVSGSTLQLWINGVLSATWTQSSTTGTPIGLLLTLTHSS